MHSGRVATLERDAITPELLVRGEGLGRLVQKILSQHWQRLSRARSAQSLQAVNHFHAIKRTSSGRQILGSGKSSREVNPIASRR